MTSIKFTKTNIDNSNTAIIQLTVNNFKFKTEKGDKDIEKIIFEGVPPTGKFDGKDELKNLLENNQSFNLEFDDTKVEIKVIEPEKGGGMMMVASAGGEAKKLMIRVREANKQ